MLRSSKRRQGYSGSRRSQDEEYSQENSDQEQDNEKYQTSNSKSENNSRSNTSESKQSHGRQSQQNNRHESQPSGEQGQQQTRGSDVDRLIADMAKGFVEAQAKLTSGSSTANSSPEMIAMLQKISQQLEGLNHSQGQQGKSSDQQQAGVQGQQQGSSQSGQKGAQGQQQSLDSSTQQDLQNLFSRLLQGEKVSQGSSQNGQQTSSKNEQQPSQQQGNGDQQNGRAKTVTAQTAAQVLAQAQYELANELEASLKKLKQVINESEKLADKISNLLGEEQNSK